jgi:hypothetical protein
MGDSDATLFTELGYRVDRTLRLLNIARTDGLACEQGWEAIVEKLPLVASTVRALVLTELADEMDAFADEMGEGSAYAGSLRNRAYEIRNGDPIRRRAEGYRSDSSG